MASHKRPGGGESTHAFYTEKCCTLSNSLGYLTGAGAQEENLFRRSNYYQHLEHPNQAKSYPMYGGIYSPNVLVFRASEAQRYAFLHAPVPVCFIAVAAFAHPKTIKVNRNGQTRLELDPEIALKTKEKMRYMVHALINSSFC